MNEAALRAQPHHGHGDLLRLAEPAHRFGGQPARLLVGAGGEDALDHRGRDHPGADRVDADPLLSVLQRRGFWSGPRPRACSRRRPLPVPPTSPATEAVLTMAPPPCRSIWASSAFMHSHTPVRLTRSTRSHTSSGYCRRSARAAAGDARVVVRVVQAAVRRNRRATSASTSPATATSARTKTLSPPASVICAAVAAPPRFVHVRAHHPRPLPGEGEGRRPAIPEPAPVTRATLPSSPARAPPCCCPSPGVAAGVYLLRPGPRRTRARRSPRGSVSSPEAPCRSGDAIGTARRFMRGTPHSLA